jgi:hypothetical protein
VRRDYPPFFLSAEGFVFKKRHKSEDPKKLLHGTLLVVGRICSKQVRQQIVYDFF